MKNRKNDGRFKAKGEKQYRRTIERTVALNHSPYFYRSILLF